MFKKVVFLAAFSVMVPLLSGAADSGRLPDVSKNLAVGQFVRYSTSKGVEQKETVTALEGEGDDRIVTIKSEVIHEGKTLQFDEKKQNLKERRDREREIMEEMENAKLTDVEITVNGKTYQTVLVETEVNGTVMKMWMSEEVPVTGIVKMEIPKLDLSSELIEIGQAVKVE